MLFDLQNVIYANYIYTVYFLQTFLKFELKNKTVPRCNSNFKKTLKYLQNKFSDHLRFTGTCPNWEIIDGDIRTDYFIGR